MKTRRWLLFVAKLALAASMLWWIAGSGHLSLGNVMAACSRPLPLGAGLLVTLLLTMLGFCRWHILMRGQGVPITFLETMAFGFVGNFFSAFLPGSVGGDVVKACYLVRHDRDCAAGSLVSIVADRLLALVALLSVVSVLSVLGQVRFGVPALDQAMVQAGWLGLAGLTGGVLLFLFLPRLLSPARLDQPGRLAMLLRALNALRRNWRHTAAAFGVAVVIMFLLVPCFFFFGLALGGQGVGLERYLVAGPFISLSMALPITPAGIGTGQLAGLACLGSVQGAGTSFGADLVTLLQLSRLIVALPGGGLFLVGKVRGHGRG